MRFHCVIFFLTLVAFANGSLAATTDPSPDFRDSQTENEKIEVDQTKLQLTHPTTPPPLSAASLRRAGPYFYRYRRDFSVSSVVVWGKNLDDKTSPQLISGLQHQFKDSKLRAYSLAGEVSSDGTGLLSFSRRWNHSSGRLRLYHQVGLSLVIDPDDQLATVLYFKHYLLRLAGGVDYSVGGSFSLRLEVLGLLGAGSQQGGAGLGLVWGF